uniref:Uncharacterized protein n=1 Tax=Aegilops tauschii subsp. strangulata TaxID=200361 RepID=A0A453F1P1_AEGTS
MMHFLNSYFFMMSGRSNTRDGRQIEGMATTSATCIQYTPATPKRTKAQRNVQRTEDTTSAPSASGNIPMQFFMCVPDKQH